MAHGVVTALVVVALCVLLVGIVGLIVLALKVADRDTPMSEAPVSTPSVSEIVASIHDVRVG
jgi:hypothetical protein